ncbi:MAG: restriction endonuclease subunit S, partial [Clostridia bacterium]|nr:restriction endonuclease subunit S [Clostridia bacterium]
ELTAELQEELQARKKQYEYYHNALMDFSNENIEYLSVGELFEIKNGLNKEKAAFGKGKPIINFTDVYNNRWLANGSFSGLVDVLDDEIKRYSAKIGDVFFTRTSETKEDIGMSSTLVENVPNCVFSGFVLRARPTTNLLLPKFCSYYFSTKQVRNTIVRYAAFTTRATTTGQKLSKIIVPILPIERQRRIVAILDRFYALCNDLTSGLPAEIEARQKQYEYYRDKLLSFHPLSQP